MLASSSLRSPNSASRRRARRWPTSMLAPGQLALNFARARFGQRLRLHYLTQPLGEFLHIAMAPIAGHGGEPSDLTVANGGAGLILIGGDAHPNLVMPSTVRFPFIRPESPQRPEAKRPASGRR